MPTTVVSSIGTTGRDYSTLQAWEDACPANLVTADQIWKGECYNDSEFTAGMTVSGQTTDATRYVWLTAAAGQSFQDHADVRTNPLIYDQSKGVGVRASVEFSWAVVATNNVHLLVSRLQFKLPYSYAAAGLAFAAYSVIRDCIIEGELYGPLVDFFNAGASLSSAAINCLLIRRAADTVNPPAARGNFINCTVVRPSNFTAGGTAFSRDYGLAVKNCAAFGFTTFRSGTGASFYTGSYNASDCAADAQDTHSTGGLTFSACFESTTADFRLKAGSPLIGVGNTDATNAPLDISGFTRGTGTAGDIGAWEYGASTANSLKPKRFRQQHLLVR